MDNTNSHDPTPQFLQALSDSGIPTTEATLKAEWKKTVVDSGSTINNDSRYSAFWRLISEAVTKPVLWLMHDFIIKKLAPNFYLKTVKDAWIDVWAANYGVERKTEQRTEGTVIFTRSDSTTALTLPANTVITSDIINNKVYRLFTREDIVFSINTASLNVAVVAEYEGSDYNLPNGYYNQLETPIEGVSVTNPDNWITQLGADREDTEALRHRVRARFNTLSSFHTDGVYRSIISDFAGVDSRAIWFEKAAPRGPGTANIYVLFDLTTDTSATLALINAHIRDGGHHGHGDDIQVLPIPTASYAVNATVWLSENLIDSQRQQVINRIENAIRAAFRENRAFGSALTLVAPYSRFSFSKLSRELHATIEALDSIEFDRGDIVSERSVPVLSALSVTEGVPSV